MMMMAHVVSYFVFYLRIPACTHGVIARARIHSIGDFSMLIDIRLRGISQSEKLIVLTFLLGFRTYFVVSWLKDTEICFSLRKNLFHQRIFKKFLIF